MDTAFMGLTSCRLITITGKLARRRRGVQPAPCRLPCCRVAVSPCRRRTLHPHGEDEGQDSLEGGAASPVAVTTAPKALAARIPTT
jgi:hypothetical protein